MRNLTTGLLVLFCGLFAATSLSGCKREIDKKKLEKNIHDELIKQTGVTPASVDCPDGVQEKKGDSFTCEVTDEDGRKAVVTVDMLGEGNVKWRVTEVDGKALPEAAPGKPAAKDEQAGGDEKADDGEPAGDSDDQPAGDGDE